MRQNPALKLLKLGKHYMIADNCADNSNFATVYTLNATAARLWRAVEGTDFSAETLADILCDVYDVDSATALRDARSLVEKWRSFGLLLP